MVVTMHVIRTHGAVCMPVAGLLFLLSTPTDRCEVAANGAVAACLAEGIADLSSQAEGRVSAMASLATEIAGSLHVYTRCVIAVVILVFSFESVVGILALLLKSADAVSAVTFHQGILGTFTCLFGVDKCEDLL